MRILTHVMHWQAMESSASARGAAGHVAGTRALASADQSPTFSSSS